MVGDIIPTRWLIFSKFRVNIEFEIPGQFQAQESALVQDQESALVLDQVLDPHQNCVLRRFEGSRLPVYRGDGAKASEGP